MNINSRFNNTSLVQNLRAFLTASLTSAIFLMALALATPSAAEDLYFEDDAIPNALLPPELDLYLSSFFGFNQWSNASSHTDISTQLILGLEPFAKTENSWHIAGELSVQSFGTAETGNTLFTDSSNVETCALPGTVNFSVADGDTCDRVEKSSTSLSAFGFGIRLRKPFNKLSYYARAGLNYSREEQIFRIDTIVHHVDSSDFIESGKDSATTDSGIGFYVGLGGSYRFSRKFSLEYELSHNDTKNTAVRSANLGLSYHF